MNTPQLHSTAPLDFPRLDLGDDRHRRFEVIHGRRETLIKVHGDAMAELNAEASSMTLEGEEHDRALALFAAPPPRRGYPSMPRNSAPSQAALADRRAHAEARAAVLSFTGHRSDRIPPSGPARIGSSPRRDRVLTVASASATAALAGLLGLLAYVARL